MRGKYIDYSASAINSLLYFQPHVVCVVKTYRNEHCVISEAMAQEVLDIFRRPEDEWVIERGLTLQLKTTGFFPNPLGVGIILCTNSRSRF